MKGRDMEVSIVVRVSGFGKLNMAICHTECVDGHPAVFSDPADAELLRARLSEQMPNSTFKVIDAKLLGSQS
jgi:hypothetical protein